MTASKKSTKKEVEAPDAALDVTVTVSFQVPYKENEQRNRKAAEILLGDDAEDLDDTQLQAAFDEKAATLLETADLTVTNAIVNK